ncbi:hypothetical protein GCM10025783_19050 [Amnibacterium soli]|uniref:Signal peptidase I n=1 Tax=Amnibacterium soli TaxID=1282736 RepID=A0ABP8Z5S0_9MICO
MRRLGVAAGAAALLALAGIGLTTPGAFGGYSAVIRNSTDTAGTATYFLCSAALGADSANALFQWPLADASGSTSAADISGQSHPGTYSGTMTASTPTPIACPRDPGTAWSLDGSAQTALYPTQQTNPTTFSVEIWFRTTVAGGKLIGFGTTTGQSAQYDRHLYIDKNGAVVFGVYSGAIKTLRTAGTNYADGRWHSAVGTLSAAGLALYVDGRSIATDPNTTTAENASGYWKVGYDTLAGSWPNVATAYFTGSLRYAAVYTTALTPAQVKAHDAAGR